MLQQKQKPHTAALLQVKYSHFNATVISTKLITVWHNADCTGFDQQLQANESQLVT